MDVQGTLYDGRAARGQQAVLRVTEGALVITSEDTDRSGDGTLVWPMNEVELAEIPAPGAPVRLRCAATPGVIFLVKDADGVAALTRLLPHLLDSSRRHRRRLGFTIAAAGVSAIVTLAVYFGWPQIARNLAYRIPVEWEERVGKATLSRLETVFGKPCTRAEDRPGLKALDALADRLAEGRDLARPANVRVIDWSYKNAFALPGGYVIFTSGIIEFMEGPDELAGVLAHEIGHVERRHVMIALVQNWGFDLLLSVIFGGGGGTASDVSYLLLSSAYSRELEREADAVGLELLAHSGISSTGFARLFERFEAERDKQDTGKSLRLLDFIRTHPKTESRIERARGAVDADTPAMTEDEWAAVKAICGNDR